MSKRRELNVLIGSGTSARLSFLLVFSSNMDSNHVVLESIKPLSYTDEGGACNFNLIQSMQNIRESNLITVYSYEKDEESGEDITVLLYD